MNFDMGQKILEVFWRICLNITFLNIIVNVNFFIWNLNITVSITLKYCYK